MPVIEDLMGLKFMDKISAAFGSYGWSGESPKLLKEYLEKAKIKVVQEELKVKYMPDDNELEQCLEYGKNLQKRFLQNFKN